MHAVAHCRLAAGAQRAKADFRNPVTLARQR
jgi:hypothetical protein